MRAPLMMNHLKNLRQTFRNLLFELLSWFHPPDKQVQAEQQHVQTWFDTRVYQRNTPLPETHLPLPSEQPSFPLSVREIATEHRRAVLMQQLQDAQKAGDILHSRNEAQEKRQRFVIRDLNSPPTDKLPAVKSPFTTVNLAPLQAIVPKQPEPHVDDLVIEKDEWLNSTPVKLPVVETPPEIPHMKLDEDTHKGKAMSTLLHPQRAG
jgi:hypothetical protein